MRVLFRILLVLFVELLILCFALSMLSSGEIATGSQSVKLRYTKIYHCTLRRIKSPNMDMVFMTPTPLGEVTLTHDRFAEHIAGRHVVTIENIRNTLFYPDPGKVYRSRNRWVFEKGDVRVVVTQEGLVTTAYIMDGR